MTLGRLAWLVGVALLVLVVNVAASFLYMAVNDYVNVNLARGVVSSAARQSSFGFG